jgi:hypothetical protein
MDLYTEGMRQVVKEAGYAAVARQLSMDESRLHKKIDPDGSVNLTVSDFIRICLLTKDARCLNDILSEMGLLACKKPSTDSDRSVYDLVLDHSCAFGVVAATTRRALADGRITPQERSEINAVIQGEIDALCDLRSEMNDMANLKLAKTQA